jgi:hypothetical protein
MDGELSRERTTSELCVPVAVVIAKAFILTLSVSGLASDYTLT